MTVSGTTDFNLEFTEIAEEAWERAGREMRSGYDLRTARRSMNLMTIEWQNRGINMWTIDQGSIPLIQGVNTYDLSRSQSVVLRLVTAKTKPFGIAITAKAVISGSFWKA